MYIMYCELTIKHANSANVFGADENGMNHSFYFTYGSLFNHSCLPNTNHLFVPGTHALKVYTSRDLEPGEQVFITYGPDSIRYTLEERRKMIERAWYFDCSCKDCVEPDREDALNAKLINALRCANPNCSEPVNPASASCKACLTPIPKSHLDFHSSLAFDEKKEIPEHRRATWSHVEDFLKEAASVYHPHSLAMHDLYIHASRIAYADPELAVKMAGNRFKASGILVKVCGMPSLHVLKDTFSRMRVVKKAHMLDSHAAQTIGKHLEALFGGEEGLDEFWEEIQDWKALMKMKECLANNTEIDDDLPDFFF